MSARSLLHAWSPARRILERSTISERRLETPVLNAGQRYRVVREFVDHDGHRHPVGEEWRFCGYSFVPYEDGMSFFVSLDDEQEWHLRLQWREDAQGAILDHLSDYLQALR